MSILADRGLVRPLRPVPADRPAEGGGASEGAVPSRRTPGSGGPARRSRRRAESVDATRKDGVPEEVEAGTGADPGLPGGSGEVVELRGRTGARRGPASDRSAEGSRGEAGRGDSRRGRGGSRGEPVRRRAWQAAAEAGLAGGELADSGRSLPGDASRRTGARSTEVPAEFVSPAESMPLGRAASEALGRAGAARSAAKSAGFSSSAERGAQASAAELRSGTAVRSGERAGFQTSTRSVVETEEALVRNPREARGRTAVRSAERAGFQTSTRSAVEIEEAPARNPRGRTAVRHIPAAVPANPGRTARERRGEPLRPPSRARVVAGRRGGVACQTANRPSVRWPWLFAIAFAACLIVTGLGVFGSGVSSGPVPSQTASVSVQPGDSLGALAARFAPNADQSAVVERIKELNNLDDTALLPGMPLTVPVAWSGNGSAGESSGGSGSAG
ncbi:LysM peptidoglycan-binding domain-containing protein [Amycolatopsis sp. cg13]|uniref:LysM peptidoglycan-binding domain-containing protein n=1 Tax=Amycolatopsis sp. cg13 TaxID=3238807 RepID=UPI0035237670